ncbi:hypothetical protein BJ322DRAFT_1115054 [Thelephora terrestris]|uniref:Uncharacterized protein n=1 Tax=Thelephora terrestris TaxID=56493 RepID=A0A9P6H1Y6_9AGAM|nr:hypothetical protein BJ322DRAFT_1115054 [Thelephora terrestris]
MDYRPQDHFSRKQGIVCTLNLLQLGTSSFKVHAIATTFFCCWSHSVHITSPSSFVCSRCVNPPQHTLCNTHLNPKNLTRALCPYSLERTPPSQPGFSQYPPYAAVTCIPSEIIRRAPINHPSPSTQRRPIPPINEISSPPPPAALYVMHNTPAPEIKMRDSHPPWPLSYPISSGGSVHSRSHLLQEPPLCLPVAASRVVPGHTQISLGVTSVRFEVDPSTLEASFAGLQAPNIP